MVCISFSALTVESDLALTFLKQLILFQGCPQNWINRYLIGRRASLVTQRVKNLPEMQETQVRSLGWKDSLEEGMATHSSIHAWRIPWTEKPGDQQSMGSQRVKHNCVTNTFTFIGRCTLHTVHFLGLFHTLHVTFPTNRVSQAGTGIIKDEMVGSTEWTAEWWSLPSCLIASVNICWWKHQQSVWEVACLRRILSLWNQWEFSEREECFMYSSWSEFCWGEGLRENGKKLFSHFVRFKA